MYSIFVQTENMSEEIDVTHKNSTQNPESD